MPLYIGKTADFANRRQVDAGIEMLQIGALLKIALFNLSMFLFQRNEIPYLYLAIMSGLQVLYTILAGTQFVPNLLDIPWQAVYHTDMLTFALAPLFTILFVRSTFDADRRRVFLCSYIAFGVLYTLFAIPAPAILVSKSTPFVQVTYLILFVFVAVVLIRGFRQKQEGIRLFLVAYLFMGIGIAHDFYQILVNKTTYFTSLSPYGRIAFFVCTTLLLSQRFLRLFRRCQALTEELLETNRAYATFVPMQFLQFLRREKITDIRLGDQIRADMGILFADIRSFTELSEGMSERENFEFINAYLAEMEPAVREHGGFIDKYIGDAIMALFPVSPADGVLAAVELQRHLRDFNCRRNPASSIKVGCGLHYGSLILGIIGAQQRMESTVISDAVNLASRLEGLTKVYGTLIQVTERVVESGSAPENIVFRFTDYVRVKGRSTPERIYEVLDADLEDVHTGKIETLPIFEEAVRCFYNRNFKSAQECFAEVLSNSPNDQVARIFLERYIRLRENPPPPEWDGVVTSIAK